MTLPRLVYLIGEPGAGKTTTVDAATADLTPVDALDPVPHRAWFSGEHLRFLTLGRHRPPFSGTDTLGMAIQPVVLGWLKHINAPITVLAEGDRLGNRKFFREMTGAGWEVEVVHLVVPPHLAAARRAARGTTQDERWVAGRRTKVHNLADWVSIELDGTLPPELLGAHLRSIVLPARV